LDLTKDKLVFLGDMIDRGPESKGALDFIRDLLVKHTNNVVALGGNHEWMAINTHMKPNFENRHLWLMNGGDATLASFGPNTKNMPDDYIKWLASLPLSHREGNFFLSHAPVPRENRRKWFYQGQAEIDKAELLWSYPEDHDEPGFARDHGNGVIGVCGHVHHLWDGLMEPRLYDHYYYLDAGCGCSPKAPLIACELNSQKIIYAWP
jgi:hypothetical protein